MKYSCAKIAEEVASVVMVGKSTASTKAKTNFLEEEAEGIISLWSEEEELFHSRHKMFQNAISLLKLLVQQLPVNPSRVLFSS